MDITADFDPEWLARPPAREQWAQRLGTLRIELDCFSREESAWLFATRPYRANHR